MERYDWAFLEACKGVPWDTKGDGEGSAKVLPAEVLIKTDKEVGKDLPGPVKRTAEVHRVHITKEDLEKRYGYSVNCPGCDAARHGRKAVGHSEACRQRVEEAMAKDPDG